MKEFILPTRSRVDRAGVVLKTHKPSDVEYVDALDIANQWRTAHIYAINTFQARLRSMLRSYPGSFAAQRLKRMPTIIDKLSRHPHMKLSTMQDIGGVRAVMSDVKDVKKIVKQYENSQRFTHILKDKKDYITNPKSDGYRGVHLIYRYHNTLARTKSAELCDGLIVEVQVRSREQHIWATAVEAVGMILDQPIKTRGGSSDWTDFFKLMSSAFALVENTNVLDVHKNMQPIEIYKAIKQKVKKLHVFEALSGYSAAIQIIDGNAKLNSFYHLIKLDTKQKKISITGFSKEDYKKAVKYYADEEKSLTSDQDIVLVSAGQLKELKKAYPNYFLDLREFQERVKVIIEEIDNK